MYEVTHPRNRKSSKIIQSPRSTCGVRMNLPLCGVVEGPVAAGIPRICHDARDETTVLRSHDKPAGLNCFLGGDSPCSCRRAHRARGGRHRRVFCIWDRLKLDLIKVKLNFSSFGAWTPGGLRRALRGPGKLLREPLI